MVSNRLQFAFRNFVSARISAPDKETIGVATDPKVVCAKRGANTPLEIMEFFVRAVDRYFAQGHRCDRGVT